MLVVQRVFRAKRTNLHEKYDYPYVWESRYGTILIEVAGEDVFVNGQRVEPHGT